MYKRQASKEPILNTYVKPLFDYFGKSADYTRLKESLYPQYREAGVSENDIRTKWGTSPLAQQLGVFERENPREYNRLYDINTCSYCYIHQSSEFCHEFLWSFS